MILNANNKEYPCNPSNTVLIWYPSSLLNSLYLDMGESYLVLPEAIDIQNFGNIAIKAQSEGIPLWDLRNQEVDLNDEPHRFVFSAVRKIVIASFEELIGEKGE